MLIAFLLFLREIRIWLCDRFSECIILGLRLLKLLILNILILLDA
jgi:hypothetical protein